MTNTPDPVVYRIESRFGELDERPTFCLWPQLGEDAANVALFQASLEWLTEHPETHNQGTWLAWRHNEATYTNHPAILDRVSARLAEAGTSAVPALTDPECGTAGCLFGWAVVIDGRHAQVGLTEDRFRGLGRYASLRCVDSDDGTPADWQPTGRRVLGLTKGNASAISFGDNSIGDLWRMASVITWGEIAVPEQFTDYDGEAEARLAHMSAEDCTNYPWDFDELLDEDD